MGKEKGEDRLYMCDGEWRSIRLRIGCNFFFQKIPIFVSSIYEDVDRIMAGKGEVGGNVSGIKDG